MITKNSSFKHDTKGPSKALGNVNVKNIKLKGLLTQITYHGTACYCNSYCYH